MGVMWRICGDTTDDHNSRSIAVVHLYLRDIATSRRLMWETLFTLTYESFGAPRLLLYLDMCRRSFVQFATVPVDIYILAMISSIVVVDVFFRFGLIIHHPVRLGEGDFCIWGANCADWNNLEVGKTENL